MIVLKKILKSIIWGIAYVIVAYFLAMQIAWLLSYRDDLMGFIDAINVRHVCLDPAIMFWQGNAEYFRLVTYLILAGLLYFLTMSLRPSKTEREMRAMKRRLTHEEMGSYTHIASRHEAKKGLQRFRFDADGRQDHKFVSAKKYYKDARWWFGNAAFLIQFVSVVVIVMITIKNLINRIGQYVPSNMLRIQLTLPAVLDHMFFYIVIFLGLLILEILISSNVWEKSARKLFKDKLTMIKDTIRQRRELKQLIKSGHIQQIEANMGNWRTDLLLRWNAVYVLLRPHIKDYADFVFNPQKHLWNKLVQRLKLSDKWKVNEYRWFNINGEDTNRRCGLPMETSRSCTYVDPDDNHSLVIGTTNSGKTTTVVHGFIEGVRIGRSNMFVNDIKKNLLQAHYGRLKADGYNVIVLDFVDPAKSECWNPFGIVYAKYREAQQAADQCWKNENERGNYLEIKKQYLLLQAKMLQVNKEFAKDLDSEDKDQQQKAKAAIDPVKKRYNQLKKQKMMIEESPNFPRPDLSDANEQLTDICRTLCEEKTSKAHFWQQAQRLMEGCVSFLLEYEYVDDDGNICQLDEDQINFPNINALASEGFSTVDTPSGRMFLLMWYLQNLRNVTDRSYERLITICYTGADERGSILSTFSNKMQIGMINERVRKMTSKTTFSFKDMVTKPTAIFMITNDEKTTYHPFVSLFVTQLYNELAAASRQYPDQRLPIPWDIIWDEFGISPALKDPNTVFAASRFRGIRWHIVVQEYSQIDEKYGDKMAETIKGNIMNTIYLLATNSKTVKEFSNRAGKKLKWNKETKRFDTVPVITEDRLMHLSLSEAVILRQRKMPIITRFYPNFWYIYNRSAYLYKDKFQIENKLSELHTFSLTEEYKKLFTHRVENEKQEVNDFEEMMKMTDAETGEILDVKPINKKQRKHKENSRETDMQLTMNFEEEK